MRPPVVGHHHLEAVKYAGVSGRVVGWLAVFGIDVVDRPGIRIKARDRKGTVLSIDQDRRCGRSARYIDARDSNTRHTGRSRHCHAAGDRLATSFNDAVDSGRNGALSRFDRRQIGPILHLGAFFVVGDGSPTALYRLQRLHCSRPTKGVALGINRLGDAQQAHEIEALFRATATFPQARCLYRLEQIGYLRLEQTQQLRYLLLVQNLDRGSVALPHILGQRNLLRIDQRDTGPAVRKLQRHEGAVRRDDDIADVQTIPFFQSDDVAIRPFDPGVSLQ